ncbi:ROK family transcriptional regulator [Isosphaeraceae bacterium EP7]
MTSLIQPQLLRRMTVRRVLEVLRDHGPCTRANLTRLSGISAPTVSKAVGVLLESGLLEEGDSQMGAQGRPGTLIRLAQDRAQVIGVVLDAGSCHVVSASLDGTIREVDSASFPSPETYDGLLDEIARETTRLIGRDGVKTLAIGISIPGLIDARTGLAMLSPNLHITDGRSPDRDLSRRLGVECVMYQESRALCLGERMYGAPGTLDDFVMLEISTGLGVGVMMNGRLMEGHSGLAGELGHVTVALDGPACGCGNRGCLETLATDLAFTRRLSERLGSPITLDEVREQIQAGTLDAEPELNLACEYLAIAVAAAINLWNPATLFIHGRLFDVREGLFDRVRELTRRRALAPSLADCRILRARWGKRQGAVAAAIHHLIDAHGPVLGE